MSVRLFKARKSQVLVNLSLPSALSAGAASRSLSRTQDSAQGCQVPEVSSAILQSLLPSKINVDFSNACPQTRDSLKTTNMFYAAHQIHEAYFYEMVIEQLFLGDFKAESAPHSHSSLPLIDLVSGLMKEAHLNTSQCLPGVCKAAALHNDHRTMARSIY